MQGSRRRGHPQRGHGRANDLRADLSDDADVEIAIVGISGVASPTRATEKAESVFGLR